MDTIRDAVEKGILVVVSTQCFHGTVSDIYATGRFLTEMGCILAQDMTLECLFAKLSYLIGKVSFNLTFLIDLQFNALSHMNLNIEIFTEILKRTHQNSLQHEFERRVDQLYSHRREVRVHQSWYGSGRRRLPQHYQPRGHFTHQEQFGARPSKFSCEHSKWTKV